MAQQPRGHEQRKEFICLSSKEARNTLGKQNTNFLVSLSQVLGPEDTMREYVGGMCT